MRKFIRSRKSIRPLSRHWYTGRLLDRADQRTEERANRLQYHLGTEYGIRELSTRCRVEEDDAGFPTYMVARRFRLPVPARDVALPVLGEALAAFLPDVNARCGHEHDCCGCPVYHDMWVAERRGREVVVAYSYSPNY